MGWIDDFSQGMKSIPWMKRLGDTPDRVDALEKRIAELEEKLGDKIPPEFCRRCGKRAMRLGDARGEEKGVTNERWDCKDCGMREWRKVKAR